MFHLSSRDQKESSPIRGGVPPPLNIVGKAPLPKTPKPASPLLARQSPKVPRKSPVPIRKAAANGHMESKSTASSHVTGTPDGETDL